MSKQCLVLVFLYIVFVIFATESSQQMFDDHRSPIYRPLKYHFLKDPNRFVDYHDTMNRLKLWRRYLDENNHWYDR